MASGTPLASGPDIDRWRELLQRVDAVQPVAASAYAAGSLLSWSGDVIELGYPGESFELKRAETPEKREAFATACSDQLGRPITIRPRALRPEEEQSPELLHQSAMEVERLKSAQRKEQLREGAKTHPVTRALVEDFGATIDGLTLES